VIQFAGIKTGNRSI